MFKRVISIGGAIALIAGMAATPTLAQDKMEGNMSGDKMHHGKMQGRMHSDKMTEGLSDSEKKYVMMKMHKMNDSDKKMTMHKMMGMSPRDRKRTVEKMMRDDKMHGGKMHHDHM